MDKPEGKKGKREKGWLIETEGRRKGKRGHEGEKGGRSERKSIDKRDERREERRVKVREKKGSKEEKKGGMKERGCIRTRKRGRRLVMELRCKERRKKE